MRYFLRLAYNGEGYHGWQSQPNAVSVQQTIEEAMSVLTRLPVSIVGAGRTDAGVHAKEMYAHFDLPACISDKDQFCKSLNRLVGKNIAIFDLFEMPPDAHARFDASLRTYKYFVSYKKNPFLHPYCWFSPTPLNMEKMNEAADILKITEDFTSFAKLHSDVKNNKCIVERAEWEEIGSDMPLMGDGIVFTISANRFLRNMVRAIVGTLVDVGREKLSVDAFKHIIEKKDRCSAGVSMPAEGLFLWKIDYPFFS